MKQELSGAIYESKEVRRESIDYKHSQTASHVHVYSRPSVCTQNSW